MQLMPRPDTERDIETSEVLGLLTAAALALVPVAAQAVAPPDGMAAQLSYLSYRDYDAKRDRMSVRSPTLWLQAPLGASNSIEASATLDSMSGASPQYLNTLSGASGLGIHDRRKQGDIKLRHYFDRLVLGVGAAYSDENDYRSRAASLDGQWLSADQNTTVSFGIGQSNDRISATDRDYVDGRRRTTDYLLGLTQVLSPLDIIQSNLTYSNGGGDFTDHYKPLDLRPDSRHELAWLSRYRRWMPAFDAALHVDYRYYRDSWQVHAHSVELSWYQSLGERWSVRPSLRYYTQSAARFFSNRFPPRDFDVPYSADGRQGAFGAATVGLKVSRMIDADTRIDLLAERYEQRSGLRWGGGGTAGLAPVKARWFALGLSYGFR
ncbi:DUF3570 domain-containing protein [Chitinimonas sp.]|uniref:DUF3570 domain-containing protein n=1 Tax=Chitinimonas sp. TaxID=1934313 RepID=UPI0035B3593A